MCGDGTADVRKFLLVDGRPDGVVAVLVQGSSLFPASSLGLNTQSLRSPYRRPCKVG